MGLQTRVNLKTPWGARTAYVAGVFHSVVDLQAAINRFIAEHNQTEARPFVWRADPDAIIAARNRGFQMLDSIH
jgi:2-oxo-4-hydroxy-4-carboxy--5-ureidoimidazoline (OHCU) decarboxylase